jgi:hypothetical protein
MLWMMCSALVGWEHGRGTQDLDRFAAAAADNASTTSCESTTRLGLSFPRFDLNAATRIRTYD